MVVFIVVVLIGAEPILLRPPSKLIVDAFRVEGMPPPEPGGYAALFMLLTKKELIVPKGLVMLLVLIVLVLTAENLPFPTTDRLPNIVTDGLNWTVPPVTVNPPDALRF